MCHFEYWTTLPSSASIWDSSCHASNNTCSISCFHRSYKFGTKNSWPVDMQAFTIDLWRAEDGLTLCLHLIYLKNIAWALLKVEPPSIHAGDRWHTYTRESSKRRSFLGLKLKPKNSCSSNFVWPGHFLGVRFQLTHAGDDPWERFGLCPSWKSGHQPLLQATYLIYREGITRACELRL